MVDKKLMLWQVISTILGIFLILSIITKGFVGCPTGAAVVMTGGNEQYKELTAENPVILGTGDSIDTGALAKCLTEKGAAMYGAEWCSYCKSQKNMFGNSFQYIDYTDCGQYQSACLDAGVTGYPTWVIGGELYPGVQTLDRLASLSGCS